MSEVDLVGVEREDFRLRVAPFELYRDEHLFELALDEWPARSHEHAVGHVFAEEQAARQLLRDGAGAEALPVDDVLECGDDDPRDAEAEVLLEVAVFAGDDRLTKHRRHVVVADHDPPLDGEFANDPLIASNEASNGVRLIGIERADLWNVIGEGEEHAADTAKQRRNEEKRDQAGVARNAQNQLALRPRRRRCLLAVTDVFLVQGVHLLESKMLIAIITAPALTVLHSDLIRA
jgi:hypothetical protein